MKITPLSIFTIILLQMCASPASAWWDMGHLLTARIAEYVLEQEHPQILQLMERDFEPLKNLDPQMTKNENQHTFVESAIFADFIKSRQFNGMYQSSWHFTTEPYYPQGTNRNQMEQIQPDHNVTIAIQEIKLWLTRSPGYQETYTYQHVMDHVANHDEQVGRSVALRLLIHYIGDVHQPMHSTSLFSDSFPNGDRGGNSFYLKKRDNINKLHFAWDSALYEYTDRIRLPLSQEAWEDLTRVATNLLGKYDLQTITEQAQIIDPVEWAAESHEIAVNFAYKNLEPKDKLSQSYIEEGRQIAEQRIILAGYRIANLLIELHDWRIIKAQFSN